MADCAVLGIFEDAGQRDFHLGLIENVGARVGVDVIVEPRLTRGCRFDALAEHVELAKFFDGIIVGVDGKKLTGGEKEERLKGGLANEGVKDIGIPILWSIAYPSVEEWITGDRWALPSVIEASHGLDDTPTGRRPGGARSERTAKERLERWVVRLTGARPLRGGLEYARDVGRLLEPARIGTSRNPDLRQLSEKRLPGFLHCLSE